LSLDQSGNEGSASRRQTCQASITSQQSQAIPSRISTSTHAISGCAFVKKTVNFDDPSTYHFYYGDETGSPGTILTFFPWTNATAGHRGVGETRQTAFRVPLRSIGYWTQRFIEKGIPYQTLEKRFGESVLPFTDQDGMALALVGIADAENEPGWSNEDIPPNMRSAACRA
jgi:hypothetical protein